MSLGDLPKVSQWGSQATKSGASLLSVLLLYLCPNGTCLPVSLCPPPSMSPLGACRVCMRAALNLHPSKWRDTLILPPPLNLCPLRQETCFLLLPLSSSFSFSTSFASFLVLPPSSSSFSSFLFLFFLSVLFLFLFSLPPPPPPFPPSNLRPYLYSFLGSSLTLRTMRSP